TEWSLTLSRWVDLSILAKATVMLLMGLAAAQVAGRARASMRHLLLTATFATLLAVPIIVLTLAPLTIEVSVPGDGDSIAVPGPVPSSDALGSPADSKPARPAA